MPQFARELLKHWTPRNSESKNLELRDLSAFSEPGVNRYVLVHECVCVFFQYKELEDNDSLNLQ